MTRLVQLHDPGPDLPAGTQRIDSASPSIRVHFYTAPWAFQQPGGGEVQLLETAAHLGELDVEVKLFDTWSDRLEGVELVHLFGTLPECLGMARAAKRCGARVALSPISWYDPVVSARLEPAIGRKLRGLSSWLARRLMPRLPTWRRELIHLADVLLPNSIAEARQLETLFGAQPDRIAVMPNGVDRRFASGDAGLFEQQFGVRDFVLVAGRIEPRKNQLAVIQALWGCGVPLVILGDPHPSFPSYYRDCIAAADPGVTFIGHLPHDSPMLAAAYAAARVVVLASWFETPGLAALEGAAAGAQVVVTSRGSTFEYFGEWATYVDPDDVPGIRSAVRAALPRPRQAELQQHICTNYLWEHVARQTRAAYAAALGRSTPSLRAAGKWSRAA